jgi:hypothetical protein
MASIAIMVGAAIVNAIEFTAGNALYDKFGRGDGSEERLRHDKAVEDQQKAVVEWNQKRAAILDWINRKLREKNDARLVFDDVDRALDFYNEAHPDGQINLPQKPRLNDFYEPSVEQNYYALAVASFCGGIIGYVVFKFLQF